MLCTDAGVVLLPIARSAIAAALGQTCAAPPAADAPWLQATAASFVTLTEAGHLRGCIGSLEASRPLWADVQANAVAAALHDPRFTPVTRQEFPDVRLVVSVLSPLEALSFSSETDAMDQLRPGIDGVVLECNGLRGTFLPQVWEHLPERGRFLAHLKHKAGLPADFWADTVRILRYTVSKWSEPAIAPNP